MDGNDTARKSSGEISMAVSHNRASDMIINISEDEKDSKLKYSADSPLKEVNESAFGAQKSPPMSSASPETVKIAPSANKPPKIPTTEGLTRRKSLSRSVFSKPKARFGEQSVCIDSKIFDENGPEVPVVSSRGASPSRKPDIDSASMRDRTVPVTPKTPLMSSFRVDEDEEIYKRVSSRKKLKHRKVKAKVLIEWMIFLCILGCLIASVVVHKVHHMRLCGLRLWKWFALIMVTFSGLLVTEWLMNIVVLCIELNYLLKKKVLYFVFGLKKIVQICIWLALVLITWASLFREGVDDQSLVASKVLDMITWTMASLLIGALLWLLKNLLLKILASSFHVNTFFDRIQESIFHQYILFTLSGPPVMESEQKLGRNSSNVSQFSFRLTKKDKEGKEKKEKEVIDINKLHQMKQEKVSAWTMKMLVDVISNSGLTTISNVLDESVYNGGNEQTDKEITNEEEAFAAAYHIFRNVAQPCCT